MISPERSQRKGLLIPREENSIWHSSLLCALLQVHKYETARGRCCAGAGVPFAPLLLLKAPLHLPLCLSLLGDGEQEPFGCEILRALHCSSGFQGKVAMVNSCSGDWLTAGVYIHLLSSACHPSLVHVARKAAENGLFCALNSLQGSCGLAPGR